VATELVLRLRFEEEPDDCEFVVPDLTVALLDLDYRVTDIEELEREEV